MVAVTDTAYRYDEFGRLTGLTHYQDPDRPLAEYCLRYETGDHNRLLTDGTFAYEYDGEGNRIRLADTPGYR